MSLRRALTVVALFVGAARPQAQTVTMRDIGPGPLGPLVQSALIAPHRLILPSPERALLSRDSTYGVTTIILGRTTVVEGHVHGDVIVVGADMFVHPGAQIDGRAIAIGGAVYPSMLAIVRGGTQSYRDATFEIAEVPGGYALSYQALRGYPSPPLTLPGLYGLRLPSYDRTNGLSLSFAPLLTLASSRFIAEPRITYRSQLGAIDPLVDLSYQPTRRLLARARVGRATLTNDDWIWSDFVNSLATIYHGVDTRNYYRADRAQVTLQRSWEATTVTLEPFVGARWERAWSARPDSFAASAPWTLLDRRDAQKILRPNPRVDDGNTASALLGTNVTWQSQGISLTMRLVGEGAFAAPHDQRFVQGTIDGTLQFPTFMGQSYVLDAHVVTTAATDSAPRQRWGYLGGSGTFPLIDLLSLGGDQLVFLESDYIVPIQKIDIAFLGSPTLTLRYMIGSAGAQRLPSFEQNLALAAALSFLRVELRVDPARHKADFGVSLSVTR